MQKPSTRKPRSEEAPRQVHRRSAAGNSRGNDSLPMKPHISPKEDDEATVKVCTSSRQRPPALNKTSTCRAAAPSTRSRAAQSSGRDAEDALADVMRL